ncbi:MAG: DUF2723 domain-containing protein [bacterium]|nr:MAG: DUF2723 domain-containing protein [bacterium]
MPRLHEQVRVSRLILFLAVLAVFIISMYGTTCHRTITWWMGCSYPLAAITFGIHFPPGSLILTTLGWIVARLVPTASKAFALNLTAAALATFTTCLLIWLTIKLTRIEIKNTTHLHGGTAFATMIAGIASGALTLAFGRTTWHYATHFTPYILTAAFTALLLWTILTWWERRDDRTGDRWLFVTMLLFGLDLSVHRTNLLILPGFLLWILICYPRLYGRAKSWAAGAGGLLIGLAVHLLIIPIAAGAPTVNFGDPSTWSRFYYYISLQQYGGSWLLRLFPRRADFLGYQLANYINNLKSNFFSFGKILSLIPLALGIIGIGALWRRDRRLMLGLLLLFLGSSLGAVFYFNLPEGYSYPMDRHYMPSFVLFSVFIAYGAGTTVYHLWRVSTRYRRVALPLCLAFILSMPVEQLMRNYRAIDSSKTYFAYDYARNILSTIDPGAILFIQGDLLWSPLYLHIVENARPDVAVLSISLLNTEWYVRQVRTLYPDIPLTLTEEELSQIAPKPWQDTTLAIPVTGSDDSLRLPEGVAQPDTFDLRVKPTIAGRFVLAQDWLMVKMIVENEWRRPIYFNEPPEFLRPHSRSEGIVHRLVPQDSALLNAGLLRQNLLERYSYRGFADQPATVAPFTRLYGHALLRAFHALGSYEQTRGDTAACLEIKAELEKRIPPDKIDPPPELQTMIDEMCRSGQKK